MNVLVVDVYSVHVGSAKGQRMLFSIKTSHVEMARDTTRLAQVPVTKVLDSRGTLDPCKF
jgi:hypothetical protein